MPENPNIRQAVPQSGAFYMLAFILFLLSGVIPVFAVDTKPLPVSDLIFEGNENISRRQLQDYIHFQRGGFLKTEKLYVRRSMARSMELIKRRYQEEGFLECTVTDSLEKISDTAYNLHVIIHEGPRYYLDKLIIKGNNVISDREIREILEPAEKDIFRPFHYLERVQALKDRYAEDGMPFVEIIETYSDSVRLTWTLELANETVYSIDSIITASLNPVQKALVERELLISDGQVFQFSDFLESRKRIFELGAYNNVVLDMVNRDDEGHTLDVELRVSEALRHTWDMNVGVKQGRVEAVNQTYMYSQVDWKNRNVFGHAKKLEVSLSFNVLWDQVQELKQWQPSYNVEVAYTEPWVFFLRVPTTVSIYQRRDVYSPFNQIVTTQNDELFTRGVEISGLTRYRELLRTVFSANIRSVDSKLSPEQQEVQRKLETQMRFDNRDNFLYPSSGWNILLRGQWTESLGSGPTSYSELVASVGRYFRLWKGGTLAGRAESGLIKEQNGEAPLYSLYRLGSENTVRGWSQSIGNSYLSTDGQTVYAGKAKILFNLEFRQTLYGPLGILLFADSGNLDETFRDVASVGGLYISAGPGVTYNTVIGPVRMEFPFVVKDPGGQYSPGGTADIRFILALLFAF